MYNRQIQIHRFFAPSSLATDQIHIYPKLENEIFSGYQNNLRLVRLKCALILLRADVIVSLHPVGASAWGCHGFDRFMSDSDGSGAVTLSPFNLNANNHSTSFAFAA